MVVIKQEIIKKTASFACRIFKKEIIFIALNDKNNGGETFVSNHLSIKIQH